MSNLKADNYLVNDIKNGFRASRAPEIVQFDVTNKCNNNCLCCWNNSPLLVESAKSREWINQQLPFDLVKKTIDELFRMGTKTIFFAGGGEPFMHPDFMQILQEVKSHGMKVVINTNFSLIDEEMISRLVELKIDFIHASILAGTPDVYAQIHPNRTAEDFEKIKKMLILLADTKDKKNAAEYKPHLNMYYVIFNKNFHQIYHMVNLAMIVRANSLEFTPIDVIAGSTDTLLLDSNQIEVVVKDLKSQAQMIEQEQKKYSSPITFIEQYDNFLTRITSKNAVFGQYELSVNNLSSCYVGWKFSRITADGNVYPCLKADKICVGNIYNESFSDIWNGTKQRMFREKTLKFDKDDPYFLNIGNNSDSKQCGCFLTCDNITINLEMDKQYGKDFLKP